MDKETHGRSQLSDEEAQFMTDELIALSENCPDIEDDSFFRNAEDEAAAEELIELANYPAPNWYVVAMYIVGLFYLSYDEYLWGLENNDSIWIMWSDENALATGTISRHLEIFFQLTVLREIPIEKYEHLSPDRVHALLKPLLPTEPTVPATSGKISCPISFVLQWWEWEKKVLSA
ncbi:MAG: hypothetical protein IIA60_11935, partial [Candidatus Marinimicrobia bacterium]|nr:hypothetical protein [Candidatus Neomarinimicrobiota bacterium]